MTGQRAVVGRSRLKKESGAIVNASKRETQKRVPGERRPGSLTRIVHARRARTGRDRVDRGRWRAARVRPFILPVCASRGGGAVASVDRGPRRRHGLGPTAPSRLNGERFSGPPRPDNLVKGKSGWVGVGGSHHTEVQRRGAATGRELMGSVTDAVTVRAGQGGVCQQEIRCSDRVARHCTTS